MATRYQFVDDSGETRLAGFLVPEPGGSITSHAYYGSTSTSIADNAGAALPWGTEHGDALLDLTTPTVPTVLVAGVYAVTVSVTPGDAMTAAGSYGIALELDMDNDDVGPAVQSPPASAAVSTPQTFLSGTYYLPAGGKIRVFCANQDGAQAIHFVLAPFVQRIA